MENMFDRMVESAFDFLKRSILEIENAPKYSIIHFCAAVEIILKARLLKEHWALLIEKPSESDFHKFKTGDFKSITLTDTLKRLNNLAQIKINPLTTDGFEELAKVRNKFIHFCHPEENSNENRDVMVAQLFRNWCNLYSLLSQQQWRKYFNKYLPKIQEINVSLKGNAKYLDAKFNLIQKELEGQNTFLCASCQHESMISANYAITPEGLLLIRHECKVCEHEKYLGLQILCPHCGQSTVVNHESSSCTNSNCKQTIEPSDIQSYLDESYGQVNVIKEYDLPGECNYCGDESVYDCGDILGLCLSCFEQSNLRVCEYCNNAFIGGGEDYGTYGEGCNSCEGKYGYIMSKDD